jgi:tetratricopeptide (TPR) repeat protein
MKQEMNFIVYIDRYLAGTMSESELKWFQKELNGNAQLQEEFRMQKKLNDLFVEQKTISLQAQLELIHNEIFKSDKNVIGNIALLGKKKIVYTTMAVAASCMLFFLIIFKNTSNEINNKDIYTEYFKPADIGMVFRSADHAAINDDLRSAMVLYDGKKYNEAISIFEEILNKDSSRIGLRLYSGISHMEIKEYEEANKNFNKIINHKANAFIESAQWYLGLCYLMTDKSEKAKDVFNEISKSKSYYKTDAKKILKKMNK